MFRMARTVLCKNKVWVCSSKLWRNAAHVSGSHKIAKLSSMLNSKYASQKSRKSFHSIVIVGGLFSFLDKNEESELITTIKRAILLMQEGEVKKSEQMFHIALKLAQEQQNYDGILHVLDLMANLAYDTGEHEKAQKLFVSVLQLLLGKGVQKNDNRVIHISLKLADIYENSNEKRKAEEGFRFCLENLENKVDSGIKDEDTLVLFAMTLDWYARFVLEQRRYKEAHDLFKRAYDVSLNINGEINEQTVILLKDLGTVSFLEGDFDGALKYLNEAAFLGKTLPNGNVLPYIYVNLGAVYLKKQMFDEAKHACTYARRKARQQKNKELEQEAEMCLEEISQPGRVRS